MSTDNNAALDDGEPVIVPIRCVRCECMGEATHAPRNIPGFRVVNCVRFECPACSFVEEYLQPESMIKPEGVMFKLHASSHTAAGDLQRQVVVSNYAKVDLPAVGFTIPPALRRGSLSTVEGIIMSCITNLRDIAMELSAEKAGRMQLVRRLLADMVTGTKAFKFHITDPSGQSFIGPHPESTGEGETLEQRSYERDAADRVLLGEGTDTDHSALEEKKVSHACEVPVDPAVCEQLTEAFKKLPSKGEASGPQKCENCWDNEGNCTCSLLTVALPGSVDATLVSVHCTECKHQHSRIGFDAAEPVSGTKLTYRCQSQEDLMNFVIKPAAADVYVEEASLHVSGAFAGAICTTIDRFLVMVKDKFVNSSVFADSECTPEQLAQRRQIDTQLLEAIAGQVQTTLQFKDASGLVHLMLPNLDPIPDRLVTSEPYVPPKDDTV